MGARNFMFVALLAGLCCPQALSRPVTIEDVMRLKMVTALLPLGDAIVLQIQEWDGGPRFLKDFWLLKPGQKPKRLTTGGKGAGAFCVNAKDRTIIFYGEREGVSGIFSLPVDGGEASLVLQLPLPAENFRCANDRVFFSLWVFPECAADLGCTVERLKARESGASGLQYDDLYMRPWNFWRDGRWQNLFALHLPSGRLEPVAVGSFDVPPIPFGDEKDYDVSPDGERLVYTAKKGENLALSTNTDLFLVEHGKETKITENPAADRAPVFSPDGKRIAYLAQEIAGYESDRWRLRILELATGQSYAVADTLDRWVHEVVWSPDGTHLFFTADDMGYLVLYRVDAKKGAQPVQAGPRVTTTGLVFSLDGRLIHLRQGMTFPPDVWALRFDKKWRAFEERLSNLNAEVLQDLEMPVVEELWYDGAKDETGKPQRVHVFVVKPKDASKEKPYPLVVMIHGGPQGAWHSAIHPRWTPLGIVGHGFVVAMPNITGSTGYGQKFVEAVSRDWGGKPFEDIMALLDFAASIPGVDASRACAMGGSYGGYLVNWIAGHTDRFKCLITHAGLFNLESKYGSTDELWFPEWDIGGTPWENREGYLKWSPHRYVSNFKTPVLVIHGQNDYRVPVEQALQMFTALRRISVEARLLYFPDEDHFVRRPLNRKMWYEVVVEWLKKHLYGNTEAQENKGTAGQL